MSVVFKKNLPVQNKFYKTYIIIIYKDVMNNNQYYSLKAFKQIIFCNSKYGRKVLCYIFGTYLYLHNKSSVH